MRRRIDRREAREIVVDVSAACNLRCPSCPVGSIGPGSQPRGLIDADLFARLLDKASEEYWVKGVNLFNWGEVMLHPELPELIRRVKRRHLRCYLSSNLNLLRNIDAVFAARPDWLRISVSGFTQEIYAQTHARGDIERVKQNMVELSRALSRVDPPLPRGRRGQPVVEVFFHKYRHNLHELEPMRAFAESLGFGFSACWAYLMPLENALALAEGNLPADRQAFVDRQFALPIARAVAAAREQRDEPCRLLSEQLVLDLQGNVMPCCALYDLRKHAMGSYLDMSPEDQRRARQNAPVCEGCTRHGLHRYFSYSEDAELAARYEQLAQENLRERGTL
jgi:MoaA/NifB/PqqE/SkfB family radical SAM enzyme